MQNKSTLFCINVIIQSILVRVQNVVNLDENADKKTMETFNVF
jgi:hypothetical protein